MQSFGLWYKKNESVQENPVFDLHINFWSLEYVKTKDNVSTPFLDIGIGIDKFQAIRKMVFHCPFVLDTSNGVFDLSEKMTNQENASNIFNESCSINKTQEQYTIITVCPEGGQKTTYLVYPFDQRAQSGGKEVVKYTDFKESGDGIQSNTNIEFSFTDLINCIDSAKEDELKNVQKVYIRFRIKADLLKHLYFDSEPLNKSFESAFAASRIIDFQVNIKRCISKTIRSKLKSEQYQWPSFATVHFLLMEPSSHIVDVLSNQTFTCRNLETDIWNDYLENTISYDSDDMLAYHLKQKVAAPDFACLVRVNYSKAKLGTIFIYCLCVILLGMIGSLLATVASKLLYYVFSSELTVSLMAIFVACVFLLVIVSISNAQ